MTHPWIKLHRCVLAHTAVYPQVVSSDRDPDPPRRRPATPAETKALAHPLRLRILRLCREEELTNRQLADHLGRDPGTVLFHVKQLVNAGLLKPAATRTGSSGALEKPYRSVGHTWWLDGPLNALSAAERSAPVIAFQEELAEAGPEALAVHEVLQLHLSDDDVEELDRQILEVLDRFVRTDDTRRDRPLHGGMFVLFRP